MLRRDLRNQLRELRLILSMGRLSDGLTTRHGKEFFRYCTGSDRSVGWSVDAGGSYPYTLGRIAHGYDVRPDLCAVSCSSSPRSFAGQFYVDSLVHDTGALQLLIDVIGQVRPCYEYI